MKKLVIANKFDFDAYKNPEVVDYANCKRPLFHGTTMYALEVDIEQRQKFYDACEEIVFYAQGLIKDEKLSFNGVISSYNSSPKYKYGDFYLTTTYSCAIEYSYQVGGELGYNVCKACKEIIDKNIQVPYSIKEKMDFVLNEHLKYTNSEKVVLVYRDIKFDDLYDCDGDKFVKSIKQLEQWEKEDIESLYKEREKSTSIKNTLLRIKNPEDYKAEIITETTFRNGFKAFTEISDVDAFIKSHNSYVSIKWNF